ncbi:MAG: hypothetical protein JSS84_13075 [Bacteroidetes bacterium]|nr:hypothetical protein [Bacteroidota bacterium]
MEPSAASPPSEARPRTLTWLCTASFINQGAVFPLYVMGIIVTVAIRGIPDEEILKLVHTTYGAFIQPGQEDDIAAYVAMLKAHGTALMAVFALRTLVRFIGTLRMWQGFKDGFHIYTTAQLLGMLVPMLIAGPKAINFLGFILALNWCYLYFTHRKALR